MPRLIALSVRIATSLVLACSFAFASTAVTFAHDGPHITVGRGDTLSQIAERYGYDTATLMRLNNVWDENQIYVGQQLTIPGGSSASSVTVTTAAPVVPAAAPTPANWQIYIVKPGDALSVLARDYRVGLARLAEVNRLSPSQDLYIGQVIRMPPSLADAAATSPAAATTTTTTSASTTASTASSASPDPSAAVHYVQSGEHLGVIAQRYGTTQRAIAQANYLADASYVIPGQRLIIPSAASIASSATTAPEVAPASAPQAAAIADYSHYPTTTEKWIDVNLSTQTVTAYDGTQPLASFLVSTGLPGTPTVQGTFRIWATTPMQDMFRLSRSGASEKLQSSDGLSREGYDYYLDDVQWVQYFHKDYAFHAAYWHDSFGQVMSHGCVNMRTDDAKWLFDWASPSASQSSWSYYSGYNRGTLVKVHE